MPIEVEGPDGAVIEFPDGTDDATMQKAMAAEYGAPKRAPVTPAADKPLTRDQAKTILNRERSNLEKQLTGLSANQRKVGLDKFFNDPRMQPIIRAASTSVRDEPRSKQPHVRQNDRIRRTVLSAFPTVKPIIDFMSDDTLASTASATARNLFGLPERAASLISGRPLEEVQEETDAEMGRSMTGNVLGTILGATAGGAGAGALVRGAGNRIAASGAPKLIRQVGSMTHRAATLKKGHAARNAAKIIAAGGAGGAAQAAGEGKDVSEGFGYGAAGAGTVVGLGKAAGYLLRPVADFLRLSDAGDYLRRFTTASPDEIQANVARIRETGAEPTLYEVLPLEDRNKLGAQILARTSPTSERTAQAVGRRVERMGQELGRTTRQTTGGARQRALQAMQRDFEAAADGRVPLDRGVLPAGPGADVSPAAMERFAKGEANARMDPFDDQELFDTIDDLLPQHPVQLMDNTGNATGQVQMEIDDRPVMEMIRRRAKLVFGKRSDNPSGGITGRNVSALLSELRDYAAKGNPDSDVAASAVQHIEDVLEERAPQFLAANDTKRAAFAARMRAKEGMAEGSRTRTEAEIAEPTQRTENAYQTAEGATGRLLGQSNVLGRDFAGTPTDVLQRAAQIAQDGTTQAALRANLGDEAAEAIIAQARQQVEGARRLAAVAREKGNSDEGNFDPSAAVSALLAVAPSTMAITKASAISRLMQMTVIPQSRANQIVDLLFSGDPAATNRAVQMLGTSGIGRRFLGDLTGSIAIGSTIGAEAASDGTEQPSGGLIPSAEAAETMVDPETGELMGVVTDEQSTPEEEIPDERPYGRAVIEGLFPGVEVTDDLRDPNSELGRANPDSWHVNSDGAVDVRPIPGMTFDEFIAEIEDAGYEIVEAIDEVNNPSGHATGPHWHVVLA